MYTYHYAIDEVEIEPAFEDKDLGVTIDSYLNLDDHIYTKVGTANDILVMIRCSFWRLDFHG